MALFTKGIYLPYKKIGYLERYIIEEFERRLNINAVNARMYLYSRYVIKYDNEYISKDYLDSRKGYISMLKVLPEIAPIIRVSLITLENWIKKYQIISLNIENELYIDAIDLHCLLVKSYKQG